MSHETEDRKQFIRQLATLATECNYLGDKSIEFIVDFNETLSSDVINAIADIRQTLNNLESIVVEYHPNVLKDCLSVDH